MEVSASTSEVRGVGREGGPRPARPRGGILRWIVEAGLVALLALTPLALGSVSQTALLLLEGGCFSLLLLGWWAGPAREAPGVPRGFGLVVALFVAWTLFQIAPLPPSVLKLLSPGTHQLYVRHLPGFATGAREVDLQDWLLARRAGASKDLTPRPGQKTGFEGRIPIRPGWKSISWYPGLTLRWLSRFLAYWALFILVVRFLPENACRKRLPWLILFLGFVIAIQGIIQSLTWNGKIFWVIPVYQGHPFGPWVNSNHFSGYMEMALLAGSAVLLSALGVSETRRRRRRRSLRSDVPRVLLVAFFIFCMAVSLVMAWSRGGLFSILLTLSFYLCLQVGLAFRRRGQPIRGVAFAALPLVALAAGILWYTFVSQSLASGAGTGVEPSFAERVDAWKGVVRMIAANPLTGSGLGTFEIAYPAYKTYGQSVVWQQAHNDYLQVLAESGWVGFGLLLMGLAILLAKFLVPTLREPWRSQEAVALGSSLGLWALLIHSLVDFNLQIPSNGLLFVLLGGLLVRMRRSRRTEHPPGTARPTGTDSKALA